MKLQSLATLLDYFFLITTFIFLALGSIGIYQGVFILLAAVNALVAIVCKLIQNTRIETPQNFVSFILFTITLLIHTWVSKGEFVFFWLFLSGGLIWLQVYNYKVIFNRFFVYILIVLGILMGLLYGYSLFFPIHIPDLVSLFAPPSNLVKHTNIGDLWAILLVPVIYLFIRKKAKHYFPLIILGAFFLLISYSRAALVSLGVGLFYLFKNTKKIIWTILIPIGIAFIFFGLTKTSIFSRPYFYQAAIGLLHYPLGTGVGNFDLVSKDTNLVHNIILEMISGMGIFASIFIFWLYKIIKQIVMSKNTNHVAGAIFLAISVNFCFNTTYTIAALVWIWFMALALQNEA